MKRLIVLLMLCVAMHVSRADDPTPPINPDLLRKGWPASWITHPTASPNDYGVFHFRKAFNLAETPASFVVHLSADNRYRFFVNGTSVCFGPARGDLFPLALRDGGTSRPSSDQERMWWLRLSGTSVCRNHGRR